MRSRLAFVLLVSAGLSPEACKNLSEDSSMDQASKSARRIAALRSAYDAFNRGDMDSAVQFLDSHVDWSEPAEFPGGGTYVGPDAVKRYLSQSRAAWAECRSEPEQLIPIGNRVVVYVHARVRAKDADAYQDILLADVYTFRDDRVIRMRAFADRQQALRWAQSEPAL